jgi:hypothetical protein
MEKRIIAVPLKKSLTSTNFQSLASAVSGATGPSGSGTQAGASGENQIKGGGAAQSSSPDSAGKKG